MDRRLSIDVIPDGQTVTLRLHGEMDVSSVAALRACLDHVDRQWSSVVLDLRDVPLIDSSVVAVLLEASRRLEVEFRRIELRNVGEQVQRVLELTGATEFIPVRRAEAPT